MNTFYIASFSYIRRWIGSLLTARQEGLHPFAAAMTDFLKESGARALRPSIAKPFMRTANAKYEEDIQSLMKYVDDSELRIFWKSLVAHAFV